MRAELKAYGAGLVKKKEIIALSKCDAVSADELAHKIAALRAVAGKKPLLVSAVSGAGIGQVLTSLARAIAKGEAKQPAADAERRVWRP